MQPGEQGSSSSSVMSLYNVDPLLNTFSCSLVVLMPSHHVCRLPPEVGIAVNAALSEVPGHGHIRLN